MITSSAIRIPVDSFISGEVVALRGGDDEPADASSPAVRGTITRRGVVADTGDTWPLIGSYPHTERIMALIEITIEKPALKRTEITDGASGGTPLDVRSSEYGDREDAGDERDDHTDEGEDTNDERDSPIEVETEDGSGGGGMARVVLALLAVTAAALAVRRVRSNGDEEGDDTDSVISIGESEPTSSD